MPARSTVTAPAAASPGSALACAADVIEVVPVVMNAVRSSMRAHVTDSLSIPQFRCLGFISRHPRCSVSDVAAFLGVTLPTASTMVDRLVRAGYVAPATSATDRRRTELSANAAGDELLAQLRTTARQDISGTLANASEAELATVMEALAVLKKLFRRI